MSSDPKDQRKILLVADPKPFVEYADRVARKRKSRRGDLGLLLDEKRALSVIMDSRWFRSSLSEDLERNKEDLNTSGAMRNIAEHVEEIFAVSEILGRHLDYPKASVKALLEEGDFDSFMQEWSANDLTSVPSVLRALPMIASTLRRLLPNDHGLDVLIKNNLENQLHPPLCIPVNISQKLSTVGRVPYTLAIYLLQALTETRKKMPSAFLNSH
jgi:hypothetical protein